ncbi:MAG: sensor histidine kinase KdpD, partial [Chlorobia bacterium]|nr:sensor histidine kinase KdpD [Fimbriimonadaceae bacterium]
MQRSDRPDPEALLAQIQGSAVEAGRGRLKVYLGMAAGVGKTYGMLSDGQEAKQRGVDVVVGYVEPHGRKETEAMSDGLERLPLREIEHRGVKIFEFDVDEALKRHPQLILVDELAHTNAPFSRHSKRWQDVEELIGSGINVATTINIQHIESLRDVVAQITGVFVHETVPDALFELADEIELVDIPPEELHQRLRDGKVYVPEKVDQAIQGFFKRGNLLALRELALRHTAERVDEDLRKARSTSMVTEPWHASERILVCIAPSPMASKVVRAARRLANSLHAELIAVTVDSARQSGLGEESKAHVEEALRLAESMGARTANLAGDDIAAEVINFARKENATTIVMGKPVRARWKEILFGSVVDATIRTSGDIDVLVITGETGSGPKLIRSLPKAPWTWKGAIEIAIVWAITTGIGFVMIDRFDLANIIMMYLVGVTVISLRHGIRESAVSAIISVLSLNFFFVHPRLTFAVSDAEYIITFVVMLAVSLLLSSLTQRLKEQSRSSAVRERNTAELYDLGRRLATLRKRDEMAKITAEKTSAIFGVPAAVLENRDGKINVLAPSLTWFESELNERAVASWVLDKAQLAGRSTDTLSGSRGLYVPLIGGGSTQGVLAIDLDGRPDPDSVERHLLEAIANQLAGSLERASLAKESHEASLRVESEKMRSDLLSSVSHDLRTPLASIEGSASILEGQQEIPASSRELARTIREEADRMGRLVRNLLDMTRVHGELALDMDWQALDELAANAIDRTKDLFQSPVSLSMEG